MKKAVIIYNLLLASIITAVGLINAKTNDQGGNGQYDCQNDAVGS